VTNTLEKDPMNDLQAALGALAAPNGLFRGFLGS